MTSDAPREGHEREIEAILLHRRGLIRSLIDRVQCESDFGSAGFRSRARRGDGGQVLPDPPPVTGNSNPDRKPVNKTAERVSLRFEEAHAS
jgi:hypothetical protein